jgi:hypothetical protein
LEFGLSSLPVIGLHLGVHKTATTYIQSRFYNSRELLSDNSISYIPLGEVRNLLTSKINQEEFSERDILEAIRPYVSGERLLISDENIIGGTNKPKNNKIYPNARSRVEKLLNALPDYEVEIFITLRSYAGYFISRYAESLRHFPFQDFDHYYNTLDFDTASWLDVIEDIKAAGARKITVTDFGEMFNNENAYFDMLLGQQGLVLESADDNPATRRTKFSQQGYEVVRYFADHYSPGSTKKIMRIIDGTHQETPVTPFMPFTEEQQMALNKRYASEIEALKNGSSDRVTVASFAKAG